MEQREELSRLTRQNARLRRSVELLHRLATLVRRSLELEPTCYAILTGVTAGVGLGLNRAMLFLVDEERRGWLRGVAAVGPEDAAEADRVWRAIEADAPDLDTLYESGLERRKAPGPLDRTVRKRRVEIDGDSPVAICLRRSALVHHQGTDDLDGLLDLKTAVAVPLWGQRSLMGVLYGDNKFSGKALDEDTERVLSLVADHAGRAIESAKQFEQVATKARTDALTGLGHHGTMMDEVAEQVARAHRDGRGLGLLMIDLDDFKRVNDTYGHRTGDALLAAAAARLEADLRADATLFRYGGEEFAALCVGVNADELFAIGERLRRSLAERRFPVGPAGALPATCSVGLALLEAGEAPGRLIERADAALL
ncbi:MAG: sensor domain-containing diguanylate cyclase, partial [Myxococcales bacterium]|nr:sensor domain-containing diguanylate cyclase [Myxococcales bacterium]